MNTNHFKSKLEAELKLIESELKEVARKTIVIEQFIGWLPSKDLRRHVQFHHPNTIHQAIALASEFESFDERVDGRKPENKDQSVRSI